MASEQGVWLSINEYSQYRNKSISTIRRYIKSNQIRHRLLDGKYQIYVTDENYQKKELANDAEILRYKLEIEHLKSVTRRLEEENHDLRMLVELYEKGKMVNPPELPSEL